VTADDAYTIDSFFQAQADAGESFDWQPPDAASALRWRCDDWNVEQTQYNWYRISATLKRVFELSTIITPVASAAVCDDDDLCGDGDPPVPEWTTVPQGTLRVYYNQVEVESDWRSCYFNTIINPAQTIVTAREGTVFNAVGWKYLQTFAATQYRCGATVAGATVPLGIRVLKADGSTQDVVIYAREGLWPLTDPAHSYQLYGSSAVGALADDTEQFVMTALTINNVAQPFSPP
jgi:hypothetical protein